MKILFLVRRGAATDEERSQMQDGGRIFIGDMVNTIRHGSLVRHHLGDTSAQTTGSLLFGTMAGSVGESYFYKGYKLFEKCLSGYAGLVTQIPNHFYEFLLEVQESLINVIKPIGKIEHSYWRSFYNDRKQEPCEGFIDGDLIESFLDLPREQMKQVVAGLQVRDWDGITRESIVWEIVISSL